MPTGPAGVVRPIRGRRSVPVTVPVPVVVRVLVVVGEQRPLLGGALRSPVDGVVTSGTFSLDGGVLDVEGQRVDRRDIVPGRRRAVDRTAGAPSVPEPETYCVAAEVIDGPESGTPA